MASHGSFENANVRPEQRLLERVGGEIGCDGDFTA